MGIQDYDCYTERMAQSMWDKNWWIDKIDASINTVIDIGCGDGELGKFIEHIFPNRFRYVGIDTDEHMLSLAISNLQAHPAADLVRDPSQIPKDVNPDTTIIIMNSVLHEILTYNSIQGTLDYFADMRSFGAKYIAIRDMHSYPVTVFSSNLQVKALDLMKTIQSMWSGNTLTLVQLMMNRPNRDAINILLEFALKYRYTENWARELDEEYLWDWKEATLSFFHTDASDTYKYSVAYEDDFFIPFIYDTFKKDFGVDMLPIPSHKKMLYARVDK